MTMIKPYKKCKKCGALIVSGDLCEDCKPMTNADRIRHMTDEELSDFLGGIADNCSYGTCDNCPMYGACVDVPISRDKWLKQEVKTDDER